MLDKIPKVDNRILAGYMAAPALIQRADYSVFKKSKSEKDNLLTKKENNKSARKNVYGKDYKKFLNIPKDQVVFPNGGHFTF